MTLSRSEPDFGALDQVLGYLNFSSGTGDPSIYQALDRLFAAVAEQEHPWRVVLDDLSGRIEQLEASGESAAFRDCAQARRVVWATGDLVLPSYRQFHADLLYHQTDERLFNAFFVGRVFDLVLQLGGGPDDLAPPDRIAPNPESRTPNPDLRPIDPRAVAWVSTLLRRLNDYLGHRPVPALESQKLEPYEHEWVRPVPLYIRGAGVVQGPRRQVVERALELLRQTPLDQHAHFDPELLDELAFDPRAYDFDHPVNKRPNYHFGQWDPHHMDERARYRRYVVQEVTLDALCGRLASDEAPEEELLYEAAAVLAGTILMGAGISGWGPACHDSHATLGNLLPGIARYRDEFYERLLTRVGSPHRERLAEEARRRRQPFGAARQHLNAELGRRRATQLQHVHLAKAFAAMGHLDASRRQLQDVPVASARMLCRIECLLTEGTHGAQRGRLERCVEILGEIRGLLDRGIQCGAIVDPWSILGFDGNFSLFPAMENSIHDHRIDELVDLMERLFQLHMRVWGEAAVAADEGSRRGVEQRFGELAAWWRRYAAHTVTCVESEDPDITFAAARHVADSLGLWHQGGAATGDIGFWAPHAERFDSPRAYSLVIDTLLERSDLIASMGLLVHWLSSSERVPLEHADSSFHRCAVQWLSAVQRADGDRWGLVAKFLNYLEANAESYWHVPRFELATGRGPASSERRTPETTVEEDDDEDGHPFGAAYEGVVFQDSAADGVEGSLDEGPGSYRTADEEELTRESERLDGRLTFLSTLAQLWRTGCLSALAPAARPRQVDEASQLRQWIHRAAEVRLDLMRLLDEVARFPVPTPAGDHDSMVAYDRRRLIKESLLERIIATHVEMSNAARMLMAVLRARTGVETPIELPASCQPAEEELAAADLMAALLALDVTAAHERYQRLVTLIKDQPLLYVPIAKRGEPPNIVAVRARQHTLRDVLTLLPRAGLLIESGHLLETARRMEQKVPARNGAVTEFDELFATGYRALVESLVRSAESWPAATAEQPRRRSRDPRQAELVAVLEQLTEQVLLSWLTHSRTLRLSVLERVADDTPWKKLVRFVERYGGDLFTQQFLNVSNIRAILHCGVEHWLRAMQEESPGAFQLLDDIDRRIPRREAEEQLAIVLESIVENYSEYRDYNSTTTLSDNGQMLYSLLDFLRLQARYDRVCWHLKPVVVAHEILVRRRQDEAAQLWRRALNERIRTESARYLEQLAELQRNYSIRMPTVADRLHEGFVKPLQVDRMLALVGPAIREADEAARRQEEGQPAEGQQGGQPAKVRKRRAFFLLEAEAETLARDPIGVGLDVPAWLVSLEEEIQRQRRPFHQRELSADELAIPALVLTREGIQAQLDRWNDAAPETKRRRRRPESDSSEGAASDAPEKPATDEAAAPEQTAERREDGSPQAEEPPHAPPSSEEESS